MNELLMVCSAVEKALNLGITAALATVVAVKGSAYRRPGARMVVFEDGRSFGMIGGGCFDADVKEVALEVMNTRTSKLRLYSLAGDEVWGLGLGCNGTVYVLIESLSTDEGLKWFQMISRSLKDRNGFLVKHHFSKPLDFNYAEENDEVSVQRTYLESGLKLPVHNSNPYVFEEWVKPPPRLIIFGAGHDVIPVVEFASKAGFEISIVDQREELITNDRFPGAAEFIHSFPDDYSEKVSFMADDYVLFMTHRIQNDAAAFECCCSFPVKYFGFLGPKKRAEKIFEMIGIDEELLNQILPLIYAPIGVEIGAETAEQVALSIVSELLAVQNNCSPKFLREKSGDIHNGKPSDSYLMEFRACRIG